MQRFPPIVSMTPLLTLSLYISLPFPFPPIPLSLFLWMVYRAQEIRIFITPIEVNLAQLFRLKLSAPLLLLSASFAMKI